jgi:ABC-type antimicrobial peptide transport system permease subunit
MAANMIGVRKRIFIVNIGIMNLVMYNPVILKKDNENSKQLQRQVFIYNRIKADNDAIYSNVDAIHEAIQNNRQIGFKYCEWTVRKELVQKKNGAEYIVSAYPVAVQGWDVAMVAIVVLVLGAISSYIPSRKLKV